MTVGPLVAATVLFPPLNPPVPFFAIPIGRGTLLQHVAFSMTSWRAGRWWVALSYPLVHTYASEAQANALAIAFCGLTPYAVLGPYHFFGCYLCGAFAGVCNQLVREPGLFHGLFGNFLKWGMAPYVVGAEAAIEALMGVQVCVVVLRLYNALYYEQVPGLALVYDIMTLVSVVNLVPRLAFGEEGLLHGFIAGVVYYIVFTGRVSGLWRGLRRLWRKVFRGQWVFGQWDNPRGSPQPPSGGPTVDRVILADAAERRLIRPPGR